MPHPTPPPGGSGAPVNASYLVLGLDAALTNERVFVPAGGLAAVDGGAGGNYTLDLAAIPGVTGSYTYAGITVDGYGRITAAASGAAPVASGWVDGGTTVYLSTSTDVVSIGNNAGVTNRKLTITNTGTDNGIAVVTSGAGNNVIATGVSGEANGRWAVDGSGNTRWGAGGGSALDTRLYRTGISTLTLDNGSGGSSVLSVVGQTQTQSRVLNVTTQSAAYNVGAADDVVLVNPSAGSFDVTLPNAATIIGRRVQIKRINSIANVVTVKSAGGNIDTVAAATGIALAGGTLTSITVVSDGINWWII